MKINKLILHTKELQKTKAFYCNTLGFDLLEEDAFHITIKIGYSVLEFQKKDEATPYHFAINIPSNKEKEALAWLKSRVPILSYKTNELHDFDFWNAKAMYFYDPNQNIVEFIARKNLNQNSTSPFEISQLLGISEIGIPHTDVAELCKQLEEEAKIPIYSGIPEIFCAMGDEYGLFICVDKHRKQWFPVQDTAYPSPFEITILQNEKQLSIRYIKEKLYID